MYRLSHSAQLDCTDQSMKHADGSILILAVGTLGYAVTQSVFVNADDDVGVSWRHARK